MVEVNHYLPLKKKANHEYEKSSQTMFENNY